MYIHANKKQHNNTCIMLTKCIVNNNLLQTFNDKGNLNKHLYVISLV